ncbi:MAG: hypothetical protein ABSC50_07600 [Candidatus Bathyarchaeia archaeon]
MERLSYPRIKDDKLADLLVARISTRETSTLTVATVTSSASLVLLGLAGVPNPSAPHPWLRLGAFAFAMLGILYREITILTIDLRDWKRLYELVPQLKQEFRPGRWSRRFLVRLLLLSPLGATIQLASSSAKTIYAELSNVSAPFWSPYILIPLFWVVFLPSLWYLGKFPRPLSRVTMGGLGILLVEFMLVIISPPPGFPLQLPAAITLPFAAGLYVLVSSILLTCTEPRP